MRIVNKLVIALGFLILAGSAHAQSAITIALGSGYNVGAVTFTPINPAGSQGLNADGSATVQQAPNYSILLNATGGATVTTLKAGQQYRAIACKSDGSACLLATFLATGAAQNITTALSAYPIGTGAGTVTIVASGANAMGTSAILSGACATAVSATATGVLTTDTVIYNPNVDPTGTTGYAVSASGSLYVWAYPIADHVNFKVCNNTSGSLTPSALTFNWKVIR